MGVPTSEVGYTIATTRRETTKVHKNMWWHWGEGGLEFQRTGSGKYANGKSLLPSRVYFLWCILPTLSIYCMSMILYSKPGPCFLMCKAHYVIGMTVICKQISLKWDCLKKKKLAASSMLHEAKIAYYAFDVIVYFMYTHQARIAYTKRTH